MIDQLIRGMALDLSVAAVRHPDRPVREESARLFWDLQYLYRFGVFRVPESPLPIPVPQPDPPPGARLRVHEDLLFDLLSAALGDPNPQPNIPGVLGNRQVRLAAAKDASKRLAAAQQMLNREIARLEKK